MGRGGLGPRLQHEAAAAIRAVDLLLVAHVQKHARMPERPKGVACKAMIRGFKSRSALLYDPGWQPASLGIRTRAINSVG